MYPFASLFTDFVIAAALVTFYFAVITAWIFFMVDLFARRDMKGWHKAAWMVGCIALPLLGVFIYMLLRPRTAHWGGSEIFDEPGETGTPMPVTQLDKLSHLHDEGTISDEEYEQMKRRLAAA